MKALSIERSIHVEVDTNTAWTVVADLNRYHQFVPTLRESTIIAGDALDARRRCADTSGRTWEESCVLWEPNRRYVIEVDVSTYPLSYRALFRAFRGTWSVAPSGSGTQILMRFEAELRTVPGAGAVAQRLAQRAGTDVEEILRGYAEALAAGAAQRDSVTG